MNPLKLCIAGSFGYADIGDEAMLTAHLNFLHEELDVSQDEIFLFGDMLDYISNYHSHPQKNCLSSRKLVSQSYLARGDAKAFVRSFPKLRPHYSLNLRSFIKNSSGLLITGGGTINTRNDHGESIHRLHAIIRYFKALGKPIFLSGQTIGPLGLHRSHDEMAKEIVESVDVLTVRDSDYSRRYLSAIDSFSSDIVETVDDAFSLKFSNYELSSELSSFVSSGDTVAVNVTEYTSETLEQRAFVAEICETIIEDYKKKIVLVAHTPKDYFRLGMIRDMIKNSCKNFIALPDTRKWRAEELKLLISKCCFAVGGRYHFIVFCATTSTPFLGMCGNHYSYIKQDGMARPLGLESHILTERETFDREAFYPQLKRISQIDKMSAPSIPSPLPSFSMLQKWIEKLRA